MRVVAGLRWAAAFAVFGALGPFSAVSAQTATGQVIGEVARCQGSDEIPASQVSVGIDGGAPNLAQTDANGQFAISLTPGQYTVVASAADGSTANRPYVPVNAGETLDIGILDLGAGLAGCGFDSDVVPPPASSDTSAPAPTPTAPPATPNSA